MQELKRVAVLTLVLLVLSGAERVSGKVYIDIDSPSFQKFPIAVTDFKPLRPGQANVELPVWFSDTLCRSLALTGYFQVLDKRAFLEDQAQAGITAEGTRFPDWVTIGAEYLVKGGFQEDGRELITEFRLFDVVKGELVVGKRYSGKPDDKNRMVMQFASEILQALTGEAGLFDTRIAFVKKSGSSADIHTINFDGSDLRKITNYGGPDPVAAVVARRPHSGLHLLQGRQSRCLSPGYGERRHAEDRFLCGAEPARFLVARRREASCGAEPGRESRRSMT